MHRDVCSTSERSWFELPSVLFCCHLRSQYGDNCLWQLRSFTCRGSNALVWGIHVCSLSAVCSPRALSGWLSYGVFAEIGPRWKGRALLGQGEPHALRRAHVFDVKPCTRTVWLSHLRAVSHIYIYIRSHTHITIKRWIQSYQIYIQQGSIWKCMHIYIYMCLYILDTTVALP